MTAPELKDSLLRQIGVTQPATTPVHNFRDMATAVNRAFQVLWMDVPVSYRQSYTRTSLEITLVPDQVSYTLPNYVQSVLGPVRYKATPTMDLRLVATEWEVLNFAKLFGTYSKGSGLRGDCFDATRVRPQVYHHARTTGILGDTGEAILSSIMVAPAPQLTEVVTVPVERECPRFNAEDFCDTEDPTVVPIPHQYIESILLPVATYFMIFSLWFDKNRKDLIPVFEKEYQAALRRAGMADPKLDLHPSK